jgi:hypothetical protein
MRILIPLVIVLLIPFACRKKQAQVELPQPKTSPAVDSIADAVSLSRARFVGRLTVSNGLRVGGHMTYTNDTNDAFIFLVNFFNTDSESIYPYTYIPFPPGTTIQGFVTRTDTAPYYITGDSLHLGWQIVRTDSDAPGKQEESHSAIFAGKLLRDTAKVAQHRPKH